MADPFAAQAAAERGKHQYSAIAPPAGTDFIPSGKNGKNQAAT
ncbi:hypothetical protein [Novispirillum itersonii]|nr:hypothetical protein [Novispirillum itersonii]